MPSQQENQNKQSNTDLSKPDNKIDYDKFCLATQKPLFIGIITQSVLIFIIQLIHFDLKKDNITDKITKEDDFNQTKSKILCILYGSIALISLFGGLTTLFVIPKYLNIFQSLYQVLGFVAIILVTHFSPEEQKRDNLYERLKEANTFIMVIQQIILTPFYSNKHTTLLIKIGTSFLGYITTAIFIETWRGTQLTITILNHLPSVGIAIFFSYQLQKLLIKAFLYQQILKQQMNVAQLQALNCVQDAIFILEHTKEIKLVNSDTQDSQDKGIDEFKYSQTYINESAKNFFSQQYDIETKQLVNVRCFRSFRDTENEEQFAHQILLEEPDYFTLQNNQILTSKDLGQSVHSIEEIMQMIPFGKESKLFCLTLKVQVQIGAQDYRGHNEQVINRIVRVKKNQLMNNGQELIMIAIKDYSDSILCKKMHLTTQEDIGRIEIISNDINSIISKNIKNVQRVNHSQQANQEDQRAQEKANKLQLKYLQTKLSRINYDFTSLYYQMKDLVDIRKNDLTANIEVECPKKFLKELQKSIQKELVDVAVCFDIQVDTLTDKMISEWKRIEYIVQRLVKNAIQRTQVQREIGICCYVAKSDSDIFEQLQKTCRLNNNFYGYLVCEVQDFGDILTQNQIKEIFSPPKLASIQNQNSLKLNLSNFKVITNAINAQLYAYSDQQKGTTFSLAVPVKIPHDTLTQAAVQLIFPNYQSSVNTEDLQMRQGGTLNYQLSYSSYSGFNTPVNGIQKEGGASGQKVFAEDSENFSSRI